MPEAETWPRGILRRNEEKNADPETMTSPTRNEYTQTSKGSRNRPCSRTRVHRRPGTKKTTRYPAIAAARSTAVTSLVPLLLSSDQASISIPSVGRKSR